jgi:hypothetical protein
VELSLRLVELQLATAHLAERRGGSDRGRAVLFGHVIALPQFEVPQAVLAGEANGARALHRGYHAERCKHVEQETHDEGPAADADAAEGEPAELSWVGFATEVESKVDIAVQSWYLALVEPYTSYRPLFQTSVGQDRRLRYARLAPPACI